jgi:hypothetical protein
MFVREYEGKDEINESIVNANLRILIECIMLHVSADKRAVIRQWDTKVNYTCVTAYLIYLNVSVIKICDIWAENYLVTG